MASTSTSSFESYCLELRPQIEAALGQCLDLPSGCPAKLAESMRYSLLAPGKRLRPLLVLMGAEACGGRVEDALPAACAVEMIHCYSLIHDDLPAMDDDDLRRGRPTNHKVFGEGLAILAGDALLTLAFETVARGIQPPQVAAECCAVLAQAAGATDLVGGQADDLAEEAEPFQGTTAEKIARLESIHRRKTGAMFSVCLELGALTAQGDIARRRALAEYSKALGLAFQICDDLLDVRGDETAVGKRVGKDSARGKLTFPSLLGIEESGQRAASLIDQACAALEPFGDAGEELRALARYVLERDR